MLQPQNLHNVRTWLGGCRRPLLITHQRPDGDALGAVAALARTLPALGLAPQPALFAPLPPRYAMLADLVAWERWDLHRDALAAECDAVIVLDTCAWAQLEPLADWLRDAPRTLVIDHHPTRDPLGVRPGDLRLIDEEAGATCLILHEWRASARLPLDPPTATALLIGIATDTGWFRFPNTDARVLRAAADLVAAGAPPAPLYRAIYEQDSPARLRLIGRMLTGLERRLGGRLVVLKLRRADFAAAEAEHTATEDLVNEAGRLAGLEATVMFTEEPDGRIRVNFRSKEHLDVAALAAQFGGGGHARAAGARIRGAWDDVVAQVLAATEAALAPPDHG
jgi:bifunctional oligoribonuclease and PAP phosphatase NrnA